MESYIREKLTEHHIICDQLAFKESVKNHINCTVMTIYSDYNKCAFLIAGVHSLAKEEGMCNCWSTAIAALDKQQ